MKERILLSVYILTFLLAAAHSDLILDEGTSCLNFWTKSKVASNSTEVTTAHLVPSKFATVPESNKSGVTDATWYKLELDNRSKQIQWYLSFGKTNEKIMVVHENNLDSMQISGIDYPFTSKVVAVGKQEMVTLRLIPQKKQTIYFQIQNRRHLGKQFFSASTDQFTIMSSAFFDASCLQSKYWNFLFYGAFFMILLLNVGLSIFIGKRVYVYYIALITLFLLKLLFYDGLIAETILSNHTYLNQIIGLVISPAIMIMFLVFSREILSTSLKHANLDKIILGVGLLIILSLVFYIRGYWTIGSQTISALLLIGFAAVFAASLTAALQKTTSGIISFSSILILAAVFVLYWFNIYTPFFNQYQIDLVVKFSALVVFVLFSVNLSLNKKNMLDALTLALKHEKQNLLAQLAQKDSEIEMTVNKRTHQISLQRHEIHILNEQLEQKVRERTKKLQKAYRDLLNLNYELDTFIYRAAHDIRGPITTIMGLCNIALLEKDFNKCHEYLLILDKYSKSTQQTLNRILGVNDLKNNHVKLTYFSASDIENDVRAMIINNQDYLKIKLDFEFNFDDLLYSDRYYLQLILHNLIDNAIRFRSTTNEYKPYCKVVFEKKENLLSIQVSDNGEGIAESIKDKIFDMFYRGSEYASGSGLGLYIVKIAIKKLGGTIVLTNLKKDTLFEIELPYNKDRAKDKLIQMQLQTPVN